MRQGSLVVMEAVVAVIRERAAADAAQQAADREMRAHALELQAEQAKAAEEARKDQAAAMMQMMQMMQAQAAQQAALLQALTQKQGPQ